MDIILSNNLVVYSLLLYKNTNQFHGICISDSSFVLLSLARYEEVSSTTQPISFYYVFFPSVLYVVNNNHSIMVFYQVYCT